MSDHEYDEEVAGNAIGWAEIPSTTKALRACKRCSLVKGNDQVKPKAHDHAIALLVFCVISKHRQC